MRNTLIAADTTVLYCARGSRDADVVIMSLLTTLGAKPLRALVGVCMLDDAFTPSKTRNCSRISSGLISIKLFVGNYLL